VVEPEVRDLSARHVIGVGTSLVAVPLQDRDAVEEQVNAGSLGKLGGRVLRFVIDERHLDLGRVRLKGDSGAEAVAHVDEHVVSGPELIEARLADGLSRGSAEAVKRGRFTGP